MIQSNPLAILNKEKMLVDLMLEEMKLNEEIVTLRRLLAETADQLRLHDQEYKHQTPQELKDRLREALEGKDFWLSEGKMIKHQASQGQYGVNNSFIEGNIILSAGNGIDEQTRVVLSVIQSQHLRKLLEEAEQKEMQRRSGQWKEPENLTYRCEVHLIPEAEGGFSVLVPNLPGCVSQGDTSDEALANIEEALHGVIECYLERDGKVPWTEVSEAPQPGTIIKQVIVEIKK